VVTLESSIITEARDLLAEDEDEDNNNLDIFGIVNAQLMEIKKLKVISAPHCIKMTMHVTGSRDEASLYALWTGVSFRTGQYEFV
jgi:hypothetical protein